MEITEEQYGRIKDSLPVQRGNVSLTNLQVLNAILYVAEQGCKWRGLPKRFGRWHTIYMRHLSPTQRLQFHQQNSGPVMAQLHQWLEAQFALKQVEPNSGLGKAITYLLRHWKGLTAFLREAGAPLDNNVCTAARGSAEIMPLPGLCRVPIGSALVTEDL